MQILETINITPDYFLYLSVLIYDAKLKALNST